MWMMAVGSELDTNLHEICLLSSLNGVNFALDPCGLSTPILDAPVFRVPKFGVLVRDGPLYWTIRSSWSTVSTTTGNIRWHITF